MSKRNKDIQVDKINRKLAKVSQKTFGSRNSISHLFSEACKNIVYKLHNAKRFPRSGITSLIVKDISLCFIFV